MTVAVMVGRSVAVCVYPKAAWPRLTARGRALLVAAYFTASYAVVLSLLLAL